MDFDDDNRPQSVETENEPQIFTDPGEYLQAFLDSDTFEKEYAFFVNKNPDFLTNEELRKDVKDWSKEHPDDPRSLDQKMEDLRRLTFLRQEDISFVIDNFRVQDNVALHFRYNALEDETAENIKAYLDQIKENNKLIQKGSASQQEIEMGDLLRRKYHNEAADSLVKELTESGSLPVPPLEDYTPPRYIGRALITQMAYSKHGVQQS